MIKIKNTCTILELDKFPDGTLHITNMPIIPDMDNTVVFEWNYENDAELFALICGRRHYGDMDAVLYLPYVPHARMDRVKAETDVFTLKYFCEIINSLNFKQVIVVDPHSNVTPALLDRVIVYDNKKEVEVAIRESDAEVLFFPDEGAMKRYAGDHKLPYAFGIKKRNWETGKIEGLNIMNEEAIKGKRILIIDDICSRGGTFYHSANTLHKAGAANIELFVTHLEETVLEGEMWLGIEQGISPVKRIHTANPLFDLEKYKNTINNKIVQVKI